MYILSLDLETTGLSSTRDDITQVALICERWLWTAEKWERQRLGTYDTLVYTEKRIPDKIVLLTGITQTMVLGAPKLAVVLTELQSFVTRTCVDLDDLRILVAYNGIAFDIPMFASKTDLEWWKHLRVSYLFDPLPYLRATCASDTRLLRTIQGRPSFKLVDVYKAVCGTALDKAHNAVFDADAVLRILSDTVFDSVWTSLDVRYCRNLCLYVQDCKLKQGTRKRQRTIVEMVQHVKRTKNIVVCVGL